MRSLMRERSRGTWSDKPWLRLGWGLLCGCLGFQVAGESDPAGEIGLWQVSAARLGSSSGRRAALSHRWQWSAGVVQG